MTAKIVPSTFNITTTAPALVMNGYQLRDALSLIAPDGTPQQMISSICITPGPARHTSAGVEPEGLFCWLEDYPSEGSVRLDEMPRDTRLSISHDERILVVAQKLVLAARWVYSNADARKQPHARLLARTVLRTFYPIINAHADSVSRAPQAHPMGPSAGYRQTNQSCSV